MRKDEDGNDCPSTLGEYRDLCLALGGINSEAVAFLDKKIAEDGRNSEVIIPDIQMRYLLLPMIIKSLGNGDPAELEKMRKEYNL